jgi:hypothetical protein
VSVAFRRDLLGASSIVRVDAAFGADLTLNSAAWSWTDITSDVLYADYAGVTISPMGRSDESSTAQPSTFAFALKNTTGNYTVDNPSSIYYPNVARNTPVRVVINIGGGDVVRAQGYANGWKPSWDSSGRFAIVQVSCSGSLRRLQQGSPSVQSAIYRSTIAAPGLVEYAPMEEDSGATRISAVGVHPQNAVFGGTVTPAGEQTLGGAKQAVVLNAGSYLGIGCAPHAFGGHWQVDWFMKFTGSDPAAETIVMRCWTTNVAAQVVDAVYGAGGWGIRVYAAHGVAAGSSIFTIPVGLDTGWWHWRVMAHDGGSGNTDYQVVVFPADLSSGGSAGPLTIATVPGNLTSANVLPSAAFDGVAMCHWAIYDQWNFSVVDESGDGYDNEDANTRLERIALEESVELAINGAASLIPMGPQKPGTVMALLREAETADGGVLFDGLSAGLSYIPEFSRYNASPSLTLNATSKHITGAPAPTHDDQRDVNRVTVQLTSGGSATYQQTGGPLGSDAIGIYETSLSANVHDEGDAYQLAAWRVHLGQAGGLRYPQLVLDVIGAVAHTGSVSIATQWLGCTVGSRIDMQNLRTVTSTFPPGTVELLLEGWSEKITPKTWNVTANCSPFGPWDVGNLDSYQLDCGASVTGSTMTTSSTTVDVLVSDDCDWSHPSDFSITIGGEEMTVTAVSATAATTPALVATGTAASSDGFVTRTISPGLPAGATTAGNLLVMLASCRDTNAITTGMYITGATGWKKIIDGVNFAIFAKVHSGSETTPTLNILPFTSIVGDTMIAQIASFSGKWGDPKSQLIAVSHQLNASAQDIAYPEIQVNLGNFLAFWTGWKADDWTSVASPATEIGEPDSTSGNDAGIVWSFASSATPVGLGAGSFVVTGGAAAISRGCVFALRYQYQTLTVTRGVNGITRAHGLGEEVHVTHPLILTRQ